MEYTRETFRVVAVVGEQYIPCERDETAKRLWIEYVYSKRHQTHEAVLLLSYAIIIASCIMHKPVLLALRFQ